MQDIAFIVDIKFIYVLDLKLIIDFIPNHISDESDWFLNSCNYDLPGFLPTYKDFFVWKNKSEVDATYQNWVMSLLMLHQIIPLVIFIKENALLQFSFTLNSNSRKA